MTGPARPDEPAALVVSSTRAAWLATHGSHPNLVRILGVHHVATGPRLMVEHIAGRDLSALIDAAYPQRIGLHESLAIARDLARGLHFLHELRNEKGTAVRLIHGTVSPALVVVGFDGLARIAGLERIAATRGVPRPDPHFAAPEQSTPGAAVDRRADVFALGAVLLRAATGLYLTPDGRFPVPTSQAVPHVSQLLEDLLRKACAPDPAQRHQSAEELRSAIERVVVAEGLHADPDRVALMVSRLLPDVAPGAAPPPPRPDQSLWAPSDGQPRWIHTDSVLDHSPASSASGFDVVSVQVPRANVTLPPRPSPLVPAAAPGAATMAVAAIKDSPSGPVRHPGAGPNPNPSANPNPNPNPNPYPNPNPNPYPNPNPSANPYPNPNPNPQPFPNPAPLQNPAAMQLPIHIAMPAPMAMISPAPGHPQPPLATDVVRLPDAPERRSLTSDPLFLIGAAIVLFFAALLVAYFASG